MLVNLKGVLRVINVQLLRSHLNIFRLRIESFLSDSRSMMFLRALHDLR
jgi:hypothetical protein